MPDKLSSNTVISPEIIESQITFLKQISSMNKSNSSVLPDIKTPVISKWISLAGTSVTHGYNPDNSTNTSQYIIIDDDDTEDFKEKDNGFIYEISKTVVLPSVLWSTMSQERLESLLLLFTEQEIVSKVDLNAVIDEFNSMGNRRMSL
ncbi:hypothetical protein QTP88_023808 [Uroleucon formosanum]